MKKPVIGCLGIHEKPGVTPIERTVLNCTYSYAVEKNGGIPMVIPFTQNFDLLRESLQHCDGILMPGGIDADPALFGEAEHPKCEQFDRAMDDMHMAAMEYLFENNIPMLGICRGCQLMNVFAGGTLYQDLSLFPSPTLCHRSSDAPPMHEIEVEKGSRVAALLGGETVTNSFHHQAVKDVGAGYTVTARTKDGVVEAIEHENGIWLGIQWHPERMVDTSKGMNALFRDLIEKANK